MQENLVDQWMVLLGFRRKRDLATALKRRPARVSEWRTANAVPASAILDLQALAREASIAIPDHLLRRK
jgi:hypothetical protein